MNTSLVLLVIVLIVGQTLDSEKQVALQKATEAFEAAEQSLHSGAGKGKYRFLERGTTGSWKPKTDADVEMYFDGDKYNVTLVYRLERNQRTKRVIIYDKTGILSTRFGRIAPVGAETEVLPVQPHPLGLVQPQSASFPWDVTKLPRTLQYVTELRKRVGDENIRVQVTSDGIYLR